MEGDGKVQIVVSPDLHFNPLPPHGGRLVDFLELDVTLFISIHSLRMEGDTFTVLFFAGQNISIHSLRMEGD